MEILRQYSTKYRLEEMIRNLKKMEAMNSSGQKIVRFSKLEFVSPISIMPISIYSNENGMYVDCSDLCPDVSTYLSAISFPGGTIDKVVDMLYRDSGHLPITKINCGLENPILDNYEENILSMVNPETRQSFTNALKVLTSELQTNVEEHSRKNEYWLCAQYWPKTKICEIVLSDTGIGYKESYKGTENEVETDIEAIINAIKGVSSKLLYGRGAGIPGIIKMFIEGYSGELIFMSGNGLVHACKKKKGFGIATLPFSWKGAFIGLRFKVKDIPVEKYY